MNIYDRIKTMSDEMAGDLTAQRRDFHKYAERLVRDEDVVHYCSETDRARI